MLFRCLLFFLFKQKTAYDMRISDWSSDVCSSDLRYFPTSTTFLTQRKIMSRQRKILTRLRTTSNPSYELDLEYIRLPRVHFVFPPSVNLTVKSGSKPTRWRGGKEDLLPSTYRSEERRVGTEGVSTSRSRWAPDN